MVQGTASSVGKSVLTAALCRIFRQDGRSVAPFKAQNMSNNSWVAPGGGELGRAQAVQAAAAGIEVSTDMNPVLLKPEGDRRSQIVLNGTAVGRSTAQDYYRTKTGLWPHVTAALDRLRREHDLVIIEGAGSPAEPNLKHGDIVNMRVALYARSPVLLVGDIDRGGVFGSLLGTLELLEPEERGLVRGIIINRFRGDPAVLDPLPQMIAERTGVPIAGVVPMVPDLRVQDEDAAELGSASARNPAPNGALRAAVVRFPRVSNFDDFAPLERCGVRVDFVTTPEKLAGAHLVILPGTKSAIADLRWMKSRGLDRAVVSAANNGTAVLGICGGFQMLGTRLEDPHCADSVAGGAEDGLGLIDATTEFAPQKRTRRVDFTLRAGPGLLDGKTAANGVGYEIHTGVTTADQAHPFEVVAPGCQIEPDGGIGNEGWVLGTYIHGLFDSPEVVQRITGNIAKRHGLPTPDVPHFSMEAEFDRLADAVRANLDMDLIYSLVGDPSKTPSPLTETVAKLPLPAGEGWGEGERGHPVNDAHVRTRHGVRDDGVA